MKKGNRELLKTKFPNIYEYKNLKNSKSEFYVKFIFRGESSGVVNFTKKFPGQCTTAKKTNEYIPEVQSDIVAGKNPFVATGDTLNDHFDKRLKMPMKDKTRGEYQGFYDNYIKSHIGRKPLHLITSDDLYSIISEELKDKSARTQRFLRDVLNPIFTNATKKGKMHYNPFVDVKFKEKATKESLKFRIKIPVLLFAREMHKSILNMSEVPKSKHQYNELQLMFLIVLENARRRGEVLQLRFSDITENEVNVRAETTKTNKPDKYILSEDAVKILEKIRLQRGKNDDIFSIPNSRVLEAFYLLIIEKGGIKQYLYGGKKFTIHDTRRLFIQILVGDYHLNSDLVDTCLSHSQGTIKSIYLEYSDTQVYDVYSQYFKILRGEM